MANKLNGLVLLLLLLAFEEMMITGSEAAICKSKSKLFRGMCFSSHNCGSICEREKFTGGKCKFWKCVCSKDCGVGGGPSEQDPPSDEPEPAEGPPSADQPGEDVPPVRTMAH